jgi:hypothetical protein
MPMKIKCNSHSTPHFQHNNSESWNLTNEEWRHFELSKKDNRLSFRRLNSNDAIIQYDDSEEAYKITAMVLVFGKLTEVRKINTTC